MLTIAFTDLVNSTLITSMVPGADGAGRDRYYVDSIKAPHSRRLMAGVAEAGGRKVKDTGDGFFLVFDDPMKAVRWAIEVLRSHQSDPIATPIGPLEVKIALHLGSPLPNPLDPDDYIGQDVNLTARLCGQATSGQVLASEVVAAVVNEARTDAVILHRHGPALLKGIGQVPVFELLRPGGRPGKLKQSATSATNLPAPPSRFVGRAGLLGEVRSRIAAGGLTVLKGEGGMGKTMLALKASHDAHLAGEFPGGLAWVNCETNTGREASLREIARVFFGERDGGPEPIQALAHRIAEYLRRGEALLILDNFETIHRDASIVRWLRDLGPQAHALLTTRNLPPNLGGRVVHVDEATADEAREMFVSRAVDAGADPESMGPEVDAICAAVGRQPLAIELLAARAAMLPLRRLLDRLNRDLSVIARPGEPSGAGSPGDGNTPEVERHRTARACVERSFRDLSAPARDLLDRTCVLPDGVTVGAVGAILRSEDWDEAAEELVSASVWRLSGRRWTIHPLVRAIAIEQLGDHRSEIERAVALAMAELLHAGTTEARSRPIDPAAIRGQIDWCVAERRNLIVATEFALASGEWTAARQIAQAMFPIFQVRGHWSDAERMFMLDLDAAQRSGDRASEAEALDRLGWVYRQQGRWTEAETAHREALRLWRDLGHRLGEGHSLKHLGRMLQLQGRLDESKDACRRALELLREAADPVGEAKTLAFLGNVHRFRGEWDQAASVYERSLAISRRIGDLYDEGETLHHLARILHPQGRTDRARAALSRSLEIWRSFHDRYSEALVLETLARLLRDEGRWDEAATIYAQTLSVFREFGDRRQEGGTLLDLAELDAARGETASAHARATQAIEILERTQDHWLLDRARAFLDRLEAGFRCLPDCVS